MGEKLIIVPFSYDRCALLWYNKEVKNFEVRCDTMSKKRNKYAGDQPADYDPTGLSQYLGLGRPIDFDNKVTKLAVMCAVIISVLVTLWKSMTGMESGPAVVVAVGYALGFLLCYMIAQELDPDRQLGGIIGGGLTLIAYYFLGEGNILVMLWLLFILRMLNRSSGDRHRIGDNVIIIGTAIWLGKDGFWVYPLLTGAAYILESQIQAGYFRSLYLAGISLAGLVIAEFSKQPNILSMNYIYIMSAAFILYLPEIRISYYTQAKGDKTGKRLLPKRLQTMMGFFLMILFSSTFLHGNAAAQALLPAAMAAIGIGAYLFVALLRHQVAFRK